MERERLSAFAELTTAPGDRWRLVDAKADEALAAVDLHSMAATDWSIASLRKILPLLQTRTMLMIVVALAAIVATFAYAPLWQPIVAVLERHPRFVTLVTMGLAVPLALLRHYFVVVYSVFELFMGATLASVAASTGERIPSAAATLAMVGGLLLCAQAIDNVATTARAARI